VDIVVVNDQSGSMACCQHNVRWALAAFLNTTGADQRYWYWFVDVPAQDQAVWGYNEYCGANGCNATGAARAASSISTDHGGTERMWDVTLDLAMRTPWRVGAARFLLIFGDEPAGLQLGATASEAEAVAAALANEVTVHVFTDLSKDYYDGVRTWFVWEDYDDLVNRTGGALHDIRSPPSALLDIFEAVVPPVCEP
jgi:hypothetical protein